MTAAKPDREQIREAVRARRAASFGKGRGLPDVPPRPGRGPRWLMVAGALIVVLALSFWLPSLVKNIGVEHVTTTAEHRNVDLPDGSFVDLGAASALDVKFSETVRLVKLLSGEAFFNVKSGDPRPFTVRAGAVSLIATGGVFNVRLGGEAIVVTVEQGSVDVRLPSHETAEGAMAPVLRKVQAGDQLVAREDGTIEQRPVPAGEVASWRRHKLSVDGATVAEVVAQLRRYKGGWIIVTNSDLLRRRVTGDYDLRDPIGSMRTLFQPFGAQVRPFPVLIVVSGS
jgi:transmembrane sensor